MTSAEPPPTAAEWLARATTLHLQANGLPAETLSAATNLVEQLRGTPHREALVRALCAKGWAERLLLRINDAAATMNSATRIARANRLQGPLVDALVARSSVHLELGQPARAQADVDQAARIATADGSSLPVQVVMQQAVVLANTSQARAGFTLYEQVLASPEHVPRIKAVAANNLAIFHTEHGRYAQAQECLQTALGHARETGGALFAMVSATKAWVTLVSGHVSQGMAELAHAEGLYRNAQVPLGDHYLEHADALLTLRLLPEAQAAAAGAVAEFSQGSAELMLGEAYLRLAAVALSQTDLEQAQQAAERAVSIFTRLRRPLWRDRALQLLVATRLELGTVQESDLRALRQAARRAQTVNPVNEVEVHLLLGRVAHRLGHPGLARTAWEHAGAAGQHSPTLTRLRSRLALVLAASLRPSRGHQPTAAQVLRHARAGLRDLAQYRGALATLELRALAADHGLELARLAATTLADRGDAWGLLDLSELTRTVTALPDTPGQAAERATPAVQAALAELRSLYLQASALDSGSGPGPGDGPSSAASAAQRLRSRQANLERQIRATLWAGSGAEAGREHPGQQSLRQLCAQHLAESAVVSFVQAGPDLAAITVLAGRARIVPLGPSAPIRQQASAVLVAARRLLRPRTLAGQEVAAAALRAGVARLREQLMAPLGLPEREVVIVPGPGLESVPWSCLVPGPVSVTPSLGLWADAVARSRPGPCESVLAVAGPGLQHAEPEIQALAQLYPQARTLSSRNGTVAQVLQAWAHADLVHVACHGALRTDNPLYSSLMLADGPLTLVELELSAAPAARVVLAACESGREVAIGSQGVLGFATTLISQGTAGLVASSAPIADLDTRQLMLTLHERIAAGDTLARALHTARAGLNLDEPAHLVNWATFTAYGPG